MKQAFEDLERHRVASFINGLSYYSSNGKPLGEVQEGKWQWDNLTIESKEVILNYVTYFSTKQDNSLTIARIFVSVLASFNIECPHPKELRNMKEYDEMRELADSSKLPAVKSYFVCDACDERITIEA